MAMLLFGIELFIGMYVHDQIIRPYIGDLLVVMLLYCFIKSFLKIPVTGTAIGVLLFSYTIEILQYFHIVNKLGLAHSKIARIIIGTSFAWMDIVAYTVGIIVVLIAEWMIVSSISKTQ